MATNRAVLKVNDSEYDILRFNYKFQRDVDRRGRPCSLYYGGEMSVELESTDDTGLFYQMIHKDMPTVDGLIEVLSGDDEVCVRRIEFKEAYIYAYGEDMQSYSWLPMTTTVMISPMRLDFNNLLKIDRRWPDYNGWGRVKEEVTYVKATPQSPPTPLVTAVKGEKTALPNTEVEYSVTDYSINVLQSDKDKVKWSIKVGTEGGNGTLQSPRGETVKLKMKEEWIGKEITVMPYLKQPTETVSVKTKVEKFEKTVFFARSRNWAGKTAGGEKKEDMMYNDKTAEEILTINKLFKIQLSNTDDQLFTDMTLLFRAGTLFGGSENAKALLSHFKSNKGGIFSSSYMSEKMKSHPTFQEFVHGANGVLQVLVEKLREYDGNINNVKLLYQGEINSTRIKFNTLNDKLEGMTIAVDDTSAYQVYVDDYTLHSKNTFSCKLRIIVYDHFGLDKADVEKFSLIAGFRAWHVLQHLRGYKPFLTSMECIVPINSLSF